MGAAVKVVWVVALSGCIFGSKDIEGDEPFECEDGADNDQNGDFDCDDEGCQDSPDCDDVDDVPTFTAGDDDDDDDDIPTVFEVLVDWTDDGETPTDTDGDSLPDVGCGDTVRVQISDPLGETTWFFGMAETGHPAGWFGEDCYMGYGPFSFCHSVGIDTTIPEVTDCSAYSVQDGRTLFDAEKDPYLTYYLEDSMANCFVWGHDTAYYGPLTCTLMN